MRAPYLLNGVSRRKQTGAAWCAREKPRTPGSAGVGENGAWANDKARDFPFGGWIPHAVESCAEVFSRRKDANKPC
ncbi:hypothetical protein NDU88_005279 [Pleurodeles waltl]|uniref:Uncharacterized protein n=1 Tax=Pleurodeles waltl TaxID=8319 RepID=A0AAV7V605_PLEWA|nr:hypothetical protein NDU88_005279 [Pleurodeles waltl]